jgi:catechol 2,3-dioxygenase-like lactoylglutathione lyase family enzyme
MARYEFTHVALRVTNLREAEAFYQELYELEVAFREAETPAGWATLPASATWDDAERAKIQLGLTMLYRGGLRLALEAVNSVAAESQLSHVGIHVAGRELSRLSPTAARLGCAIVTDRADALVFDDRWGVRWEINTFPYHDPKRLSTGARLDRWLKV